MHDGNIQEMSGVYYQRTILPSGQSDLVEVNPPREVLEAESAGSADVSEMMYRTLEGEANALIKKVAVNPEAFEYSTWARASTPTFG